MSAEGHFHLIGPIPPRDYKNVRQNSEEQIILRTLKQLEKSRLRKNRPTHIHNQTCTVDNIRPHLKHNAIKNNGIINRTYRHQQACQRYCLNVSQISEAETLTFPPEWHRHYKTCLGNEEVISCYSLL